MRLKWVSHNFKWEEEKKKEKKKPGTKKVGPLFRFFSALFFSSSRLLQRRRVRVLIGDPKCFCEDEREAAEFEDCLQGAGRGGNCQHGRIKCAGRWAGLTGRARVNGIAPRPPYTPAVYICCTEHTHNLIETHTHTVEHSKINAVRATMIPLHYLHTGPPSCARLPHCPLHCFSMEVVITKANISCSLCLQLPSTSPLFLSVPALCQLVTQLKVCQCWWQHQCGSLCVSVSAVLWDYLVPSWCAIKAQCGTPDSDQSSGSNTHCVTTTEKCLMYHCSICCTIHCWFNRLGSERCSLLHGIFHYQQCS